MALQITGRHMTISDEHREYIDKKFTRFTRICPTIDESSITLTKEKLEIVADGRIKVGSLSVQATASAKHALEAIDKLIDSLDVQFSKAKARRQDHKHDRTALSSEEERDETYEEEAAK